MGILNLVSNERNLRIFSRLIFSFKGDLILTTPSLESSRVNNDPMYRYEGELSARLPKEIDHRILAYDSLENRRYQLLRMKQPVPRYVTRIFHERCKMKLLCPIDSIRFDSTECI